MNARVNASTPLVSVEDLNVSFGREARAAVRGVSFQLHRGECLALVGESGSGKSVTCRTLLGLSGPGSQIRARRLHLDGEDVRHFAERDWRHIRGRRVGFILQDALGSLDPLRTVEDEVGEVLRVHTRLSRPERITKVLELLRAVGIQEPELRASQHPHQLSGGLRQRALIASAIACDPELLIADEPTTALDASVQAQVLDLLESLRTPDNALLVISHDLAVVARLADRVIVLRQGEIVEEGSTETVLRAPSHPYTQSLLKAAISVHSGTSSPRRAASSDEPPLHSPVVLRAQDLSKSFQLRGEKRLAAVSEVSLELREGETLGIVGESGSGKTTLLRMILGLESPDQGRIEVNGKNWRELSPAQIRQERQYVQAIFQDPLASFDPRYTVERVVVQALELKKNRSEPERRERLHELLDLVRLSRDVLGRRPLELSGGQRQRVAIARALAMEPSILVCDEPVSALDVSVQNRILDLLEDLKQRLRISTLFISHDLGIVRRLSDRVVVMKNGRVVESGAADSLFARPRHPYTMQLLSSIPRLHTDPGASHA